MKPSAGAFYPPTQDRLLALAERERLADERILGPEGIARRDAYSSLPLSEVLRLEALRLDALRHTPSPSEK